MLLWVLAFIGLGAVAAIDASNDASTEALATYQLYHKIGDGGKVEPRGKITISRPGEGDLSGGLAATFHPPSDFSLDLTSFDGMVEQQSLYTLIVQDGEDGSSRVSTSISGCSLRRANLREEISLLVGPTGRLVSVSHRPLVSSLAPSACDHLRPLSERPDAGQTGQFPFRTAVALELHRNAAAIPAVLPQSRPPPGLKWYRRNAKNNPGPVLGSSRGDGDGSIPFPDDEKPTGFKSSFLYRYWYIVLPLVIMGLFGGVEEEPQRQQTSREGGPPVSRGADARQGQKVRRGKRD